MIVPVVIVVCILTVVTLRAWSVGEVHRQHFTEDARNTRTATSGRPFTVRSCSGQRPVIPLS